MLSAAANAISEGDVAHTAVMRQQRWELAPFCGIMSAVLPGFIMQGGLSGGQPRFPSWLGKNSTASKNRRLARDLHSHMMAHTSAGKLQTLLTYLPALHQALSAPLARSGAVRARSQRHHPRLRPRARRARPPRGLRPPCPPRSFSACRLASRPALTRRSA